MTAVWAGIDSGKRAHHCAVIDTTGRMLLSQRVVNDEAALLELIAAVLALAGGDQVVWATDLNAGGAALFIALLAGSGQQVLYIPGRIVHHAAATYRGDGKTDAKDARIIADQARMRTDLQPVRSADQISTDLRRTHTSGRRPHHWCNDSLRLPSLSLRQPGHRDTPGRRRRKPVSETAPVADVLSLTSFTVTGMTSYRLGYARVSTGEQDPAAQVDALSAAGVDQLYVDGC
jgi:hypothetical protein